MKVILSRQANVDLKAQLDWLVLLSPSAARSAQRLIRRQLTTLAQFPAAGRVVDGDEREWPIRFGRDGFIVVYRIRPDHVVSAASSTAVRTAPPNPQPFLKPARPS